MLRQSPENPGKGRKPSKGVFQPEPSTDLPGSTLLSQCVRPQAGEQRGQDEPGVEGWRGGVDPKGSTWRWGPGGMGE